ncbi:hypothetical protein QR680_013600 [Steinernema hermaphroditum]|uniref:Peptidase S1 domain-containing protein n=1 Tax=Steinernema hermaphroditum TaxID=289476 RepID=A0AA39I626_9BILA|nr:hypothetical protein QR680_013600 [Steinernema hermaphroditum]
MCSCNHMRSLPYLCLLGFVYSCLPNPLPSTEEPPYSDAGLGTAGHIVRPGAFPFQVLITMIHEEEYNICGGAILSPRHVLTAAHCFPIPLAQKVAKVYAGIVDRERKEGPEVQTRRVTKVVIHPKYDDPKSLYDVAIIELDAPLAYTSRVQPTKIYADDSFVDVTAQNSTIALGFGWDKLINNNYEGRRFMRFLEVPIINHQKCYNEWKKNDNQIINSKMICAGDVGTGVERGDSGGALVYIHKDGKSTELRQIGVVSFGEDPQAGVLSIDVYSRASSYCNFIAKHTDSEYQCL